jgi:hypothetical protein
MGLIGLGELGGGEHRAAQDQVRPCRHRGHGIGGGGLEEAVDHPGARRIDRVAERGRRQQLIGPPMGPQRCRHRSVEGAVDRLVRQGLQGRQQ